MNSDISLLADEIGRGLYGELDYRLEALNVKRFEVRSKLKFSVAVLWLKLLKPEGIEFLGGAL